MQLAQIWQRSRQIDTAKDGSSTSTGNGRSHKPSGWGYQANRGGGRSHRLTEQSLKEDIPPPDDRQPVVIGGSILDLTAKIQSPKIMVSMMNNWCYFCINFNNTFFLERRH